LEGDVKVYNQRSVIDRDFVTGEDYINREKFEELRAFQIFAGDLLVTTRGTIGKCAIVPNVIGEAILHPCLIRVQADQTRILNRFLELVIQDANWVLEQLKLASNATTIEVIYSDTLKEVRLAIPPVHEQTAIVNYVDRKIAEVDHIISLADIAIKRLQEYRTALITAAVTGKIDVRGAALGNETMPEAAA